MIIINYFDQVLKKVLTSKKLENYQIQEKVLQCLVQKYPNHDSLAVVDLKVKLLNLFYSTSVIATTKMAEHIYKIKNIDARLKKGDKSLVKEIASFQGRFFYSFATKYCALHQPELFPIYDSVVSEVFKCMLLKGQLAPKYIYSRNVASVATNTYSGTTFNNNILHDYDEYCKLYQYFMSISGLGKKSVRDVDWYIWGGMKLGIKFDLKKYL